MEYQFGMPALGLALISMALSALVKDGEITEKEATEELKRITEVNYAEE